MWEQFSIVSGRSYNHMNYCSIGRKVLVPGPDWIECSDRRSIIRSFGLLPE